MKFHLRRTVRLCCQLILLGLCIILCLKIVTRGVGFSVTTRPEKSREELARETVGYFFPPEQSERGQRMREPLPSYRSPCWTEPVSEARDPWTNNYLNHPFPHKRALRMYLSYLSQSLHQMVITGKRDRVRCLPALYLGGIYKAGTTDLYEALQQHPQIRSGVLKEPMWNFLGDRRYNVTFEDYLQLFDKAALEISSSTENHSGILLDATPGALLMYPWWQNLPWNVNATAPRLMLADHLKVINPRAKFIFMLRDPVTWVESCYNFFRRLYPGFSARDLHARIAADVESYTTCVKSGGSQEECVYRNNGDLCSLLNTFYSVHLKRWLANFGEKNVLGLTSQEYFTDRRAVLRRICSFLGISPLDADIVDKFTAKGVRNRRAHDVKLSNLTTKLVLEFTENFGLGMYMHSLGGEMFSTVL